MKKNIQTVMRIVMAVAIAFGVETTASAQLGGLLNKAKKAVKEKVSDTKNNAKSSVKQQAESTVSETVGTESSSAETSYNSGSGNSGKYEFKKARKCDWTIDGDIDNIIGCAEYYAQQMQNSMKKGYKGLDFKSYCEMMQTKTPLTYVLDARIDLGLGPKSWDAQQSKKNIDALIWDFKCVAWKGIPDPSSDKTVTLKRTQFIIDRGLTFSDATARAAYFDMAYTCMHMAIDKIDGTESAWTGVQKGLNELFASMPDEYKGKYPATLSLDVIKANTTRSANMKKTMAMLIAYKQAAKNGKYGKMPASANASLEKQALNSVKAHRAYWGKATKAWVGPVTSTKKNALGQVITKYRSVKVLCEDQGYKVIHNFALYTKTDNGSVQMTGPGWENGDQDIELMK
jgi:ethanolamine utilization protein EutQ (cupin superfamily)